VSLDAVSCNEAVDRCRESHSNGTSQPVPNQEACSIGANQIGSIVIHESARRPDQLSFWGRLGVGDSATLSATASIVGAAFAIFIGFIAYFFNRNQLRAQAAHNQITMLLSIDGHLIDKPKLWWIWDDNDRPGPPEDKPKGIEDIGQRKALLAAYFNMFEVVYEFYFNTIRLRLRRDQEKWDAWERYIIHFFANSQEARNLFPSWAHMYSEAFVTKMNDFIRRGAPTISPGA
jgi:hypothetical protein